MSTPTTVDQSFLYFSWKQKNNRQLIYLAMAASILQFILFKYCYPFASYFQDSYTYLSAAVYHHTISFRPIGYSRALQFLHLINTSDTFVVGVQYFLIQISILFLFLSVCYFLRPGRLIRNILFILLFINPLTIYLGNCLISDPLFNALSITWIAFLLWIVVRPSWPIITLQLLLLFLIFSIRYAALYYPLITAFAFILAPLKLFWRLTGILLSTIVIFTYVQLTSAKVKKETGTRVFSAFSGWQMANNGLHVYPYVKVDSNDFTSPECRKLNRKVAQYFASTPDSHVSTPQVTTDYMWSANGKSFLKEYMYAYGEKNKEKNYFKNWVAVSPIFHEFGSTLIRKHPTAFTKYFLWPNTKVYLVPDLEILNSYNERMDTVDILAKNWFRYKTTHVTSISVDAQKSILKVYPYFFLLINLATLALMFLFLLKFKTLKAKPTLFKSTMLVLFFWITNYAFNTFTTMVVFRYQYLALIVLITFIPLLLSKIIPKRS